MKKFLLTLAATGALAAAAAPAAAQSWRDNDNRGYDQRGYAGHQMTTGYFDSLEWKINNAAQERRISRQEARQLLNEWRQVQPLAWRVETGRASGWERQRLQNTASRIERAVNSYARNDRRRDNRHDNRRDDYGYGYGRDFRR